MAEVVGQIMERQWEEFANGPVVRQSDRVHVTINKRGSIYLNRVAHEAIGKPERVILMYDRQHSTIGITRADENRKNAYAVSRKDKRGINCRVIYASNFCRFYQIKPDETLAFTAAEVDKQGVLVLDLNAVAPSRRAH